MVNTLDVGSSPTFNYVGRGPVLPELNMLLNAVDYDCCGVLSIIGDSTGDATDKWFYRFCNETLPTLLPSACIRYCHWDDTQQKYLGWSTLQAGASGARKAIFNGTDNRITLNGDLVAASSSDFEFEWKMDVPTWPVASQQRFAGQLGGAGQQSWYITFETSGTIALRGSTDGTALSVLVNATVTPTINVPISVKVTLVASTGVATVYTSTDDGATWVSAGTSTSGAFALHSSTSDLQLGGASGVATFIGNVYQAVLRDGINGPARTPYAIDAWGVSTTGDAPSNNLGGSPTLYVFNGSWTGMGLTYFSDTTRLPKMNMISPVQLTFLNTINNDVAFRGLSRWSTAWTSFVTALRARLPTSAFIGINQSPRDPAVTAGKVFIDEQRQMARGLPFLLQRFGIPVIDLYHPFKGSTLSTVIPDGVHPSTAGTNLQLGALGKVAKASPI